MFKLILIGSILCCSVILQCSAQGNNLYLPPKEEPGYDYPKPGGAPPAPGKPPGKPAGPPSKDEPHEPGMPFDFNYAVNDIESSNDFNHKSNSDGDVTQGEYRVQLPDGRVQVVRYTADWKSGYNAEVSYE